MGEQDYFKSALSNFMYDAACGGAISHRADMGDSVSKITEELDFPMPYAKVQQAVWKHYIETSVILLEEPGRGKEREQYRFVKEQNKYGTTSFRRIKVTEDAGKVINWKTKTFQTPERNTIIKYVEDRLRENGEACAYMSCDFGRIQYKDAKQYEKILQILEPKQREYIEGLPWELSRCYHKLDKRMEEILLRLCRCEMYRGTVYFFGLEEQIEIV